jgi:hypothetical protein
MHTSPRTEAAVEGSEPAKERGRGLCLEPAPVRNDRTGFHGGRDGGNLQCSATY